jgi:hypothetical protein
LTDAAEVAPRRPPRLDLVLAAAVVTLPLWAGFLGVRGPRSIRLNFGPGDGPYVSGFAPSYEIDDRVATHWTTYDAGVLLPLVVEGGPVEVSYRFARVFGETAVVDVSLAGQPIDHFQCRGGVFQERRAAVAALPPTPVRLSIVSDSHERKNLGLKMDWLRVDLGEGARVRLGGRARVTGALVIALVLALHGLGGWRWRGAALLTAPWSLALSAGLLRDPWFTYRLLRGVPLALGLFGGAGLLLAFALRRRGLASKGSLRTLVALGIAAFLLRAAAVSHPDFYYPDLRTHARLVEKVQEGGLDFFRQPSRYVWEHGVWRTEAYGKTYAFPYSPAFHLPFAALALPYDTLLVAMKLTAAALTVVPLVLVWTLARRWGAYPLGAVLMVLVPTYTSRLTFAFLPALFGHAVDMAALVWLAGHLDRLCAPRVAAAAVALVAAVQLAYVSGVMNSAALVLSLIVAALALRRPADAARIAAVGLAGAAVALVLYYRDFLGMVLDVVPRAVGQAGAPVASRYPVESFWPVAWARTHDFFDGFYPALAVAGLVLLWRSREEGETTRRWLMTAWLGADALLLLGRAKVPDVFLHGHETLLVTPLVCLAAGHALACLRRVSRAGRWAGNALVAVLAAQGLYGQWCALADQLGNAR